MAATPNGSSPPNGVHTVMVSSKSLPNNAGRIQFFLVFAAVIEDFLTEHMRNRASDSNPPVVRRAVLDLLRDPGLSVRQFASRLDISERQLSRRFKVLIGTNPKQFARVARMGNVVAARRLGGAWVDITYECGFNDQAHLVNEFKSMTGKPPGAFFRAAATPRNQRLNASLATSDFYNTFVI